MRLRKTFGYKQVDVFNGHIFIDMEKDFIDKPITETQCNYHKHNSNKVYEKIEG